MCLVGITTVCRTDEVQVVKSGVGVKDEGLCKASYLTWTFKECEIETNTGSKC